MRKITKKNNFAYLFAALTMLLFFAALSREIEGTLFEGLVDASTVAALLLGVHSLKSERSWSWAVYIMALTLALLLLAKSLLGREVSEFASLLILLLFFSGSFWLSVRQIVMSRIVDANMMIGSVVLYLLLGLAWTALYLLLIKGFPEGFSGLEPLPWQENFLHVAYYSFVTLTTLGYGDIAPRCSLCRFFVLAEAVAGVFYVAVIVSSLVSARMNDNGGEK